MFHPTVGPKVVQGTTLMYIGPANDFRMKQMLEDK